MCYGGKLTPLCPSLPLPLCAYLWPLQNGGKPDSPEAEDPYKRYIRNGRDLSRLVYTDIMYT